MTSQEQHSLPLASACAKDGASVCAEGIVRQRTDCAHCTQAAQRLWHQFSTDCHGCNARKVRRSQLFFHAYKTGKQSRAYQDMQARYGVTHEEVKAAAAADKVNS